IVVNRGRLLERCVQPDTQRGVARHGVARLLTLDDRKLGGRERRSWGDGNQADGDGSDETHDAGIHQVERTAEHRMLVPAEKPAGSAGPAAARTPPPFPRFCPLSSPTPSPPPSP